MWGWSHTSSCSAAALLILRWLDVLDRATSRCEALASTNSCNWGCRCQPVYTVYVARNRDNLSIRFSGCSNCRLHTMSSPAAPLNTSREPWCFYAHLHRPAKAEETEQGHVPAALQLPEVLAQVCSRRAYAALVGRVDLLRGPL
jgi:hypothetical protein